jgi:hypothetical protein
MLLKKLSFLQKALIAFGLIFALPGMAIAVETQTVTLSPSAPGVLLGDTLTLGVSLTATDDTTTGLGVRVHYDSSKLTFDSFSDVFSQDLFAQDTDPQDDIASNYDGDATTDKYFGIAWTNFSGAWPGAGTSFPLALFNVNFATIGKGSTHVNISFSSTGSGSTGVPNNSVVTISSTPTQISFTNAALSQTTDDKGTMTVELQDAQGDPAAPSSDVVVTLSSDSSGPLFFAEDGTTAISSITISSGSTSANFKYQDTKVGTPTVTATTTSYGSATQQQTITVGALAALTVAPDTADVQTGATQQFTVSGADQFGNAVASLGTITWTVQNGIGTIDASGLFTAEGKPGQGTVTAASDAGGQP